jgi:N-acylneuraminate cytidylyltransferase
VKPLVIIPARGGSKGVPGKNIKLLGGKPLIQYTIEAAREIFNDEVIFVSTDSPQVKETVESLGLKVPFLRPPELATDSSGTNEVLIHSIQKFEEIGYHPDIIFLLQATSPFRTGSHIKRAMLLYDDTCEMVVSVKETRANPYYLLFEENNEGWLEKSKNGDFATRQQCPTVYELNGAIYIITVSRLNEKPIKEFTRIRKYVMDDLSSHDIDTLWDWEVAEIIAKKMSFY